MKEKKSNLDILYDELKLFDKRIDAYVPMKRTRVLKTPTPAPKIEIVDNELDSTDPLAPVLKIIRDGDYEFIPWRDCVKGDRSKCDRYDELVVVSNAFCEDIPKNDQKDYRNPPDALFLRTLPRACRVCLHYQHLERKQQNRASRRFARWLRLKLHLKKSPSKAS